MKNYFKFAERGADLKTELLSGLATFLTMAYIVFVNPGILSAAGVPFAGAVTATAIGAAFMCVIMGLVSNRPLALASGMGINAVLAFSVIGFQQANVPWQVGMSVIFAEGLLILVLVLTGFREAVMDAIPLNLKRAIGVGIGLFITLIGLNEGGIIRPAPITMVALGDFSRNYVWVTLIGFFATAFLMAAKVKGDILWGIAAAGAAALFFGVASLPQTFFARPDFSTFFAPFQTVDGSMALSRIFVPSLGFAVFALMLTDFFDTMGTVVAVGEQAGFVNRDGSVRDIKKILLVDSAAAATGGLFGSSSITTYIESAAGVAEGGRTGLTAVVTGLLFALCAFFSPLIQMVGGGYRMSNAEHYVLLSRSGFQVPPDLMPPGTGDYFVYPITAGALIIVGALMMKTVREIEWEKFDEALPAFLTMTGIPLTYNISHGIGFGFIAYVAVKAARRKWDGIHPLMWLVSAAFLFSFVMSGK
ncbi:MAG: NCS2 family permease [Elusimicrobia bacterium CG08_land_8_20_14_0_20_59_10]|nr:MAG: NCS2 family permease [Elusimicrobia bacterium CG08_land_8_20_14_0_20_59_10]